MAAVAMGLALASPAYAAQADEDRFKLEIDEYLGRLGAGTKGAVKWDGSDGIAMREDGGAVVATIANGRIRIEEIGRIVFDKIVLRRAPKPGDDTRLVYEMILPGQSVFTAEDGTTLKLTLKGGTATAQLDTRTKRAHESKLSITGARLEQEKTGTWINIGTIDSATMLDIAGDGTWKAPGEVGLAGIEFFFPDGPIGGTVERILYTVKSSGPDAAKLEQLRGQFDAVQKDDGRPPERRLAEILRLLPAVPAVFNELRGEFTVEGVAVRAVNGEKLVALRKAVMGGALDGLSGATATLRIALGHEGLELSPSIVDPAKVPERFVFDFGFEDVATAPLRSLIEAAAKLNSDDASEKAQATGQMLGAAAMLAPVVRVYEAGVQTKDVGIEATATAKGSPLSPKGYSAEGDVLVRGFDALSALLGPVPGVDWLMLARELASEDKAADGTLLLKYHLASVPQKWLTLNGSDVGVWFGGAGGPEGQRVLLPHDPPMQGNDVRAVQRALTAVKLKVPQDGVYAAATAVAVARFQKQNGLDVTGAVDAATRQKLPLKPEPKGKGVPDVKGGGGVPDAAKKPPPAR